MMCLVANFLPEVHREPREKVPAKARRAPTGVEL